MSQKINFKLDFWVHKWDFSLPRHLVDNVPAAAHVLGTCPCAGVVRTPIMNFLLSFYSM